MSAKLKEFTVSYKGDDYKYDNRESVWAINGMLVAGRYVPNVIKNLREKLTDDVSRLIG